MEHVEQITASLTRPHARSHLQAGILLSLIFLFLPLTRLITEPKPAPVEINEILRLTEAQEPAPTSPAFVSPDSLPLSTKTVALDPLPFPAPASLPTRIPTLPFADATHMPTIKADFDFPLAEAPPTPPLPPAHLDQTPQLLYQPDVIYPYALQRKRIAGKVTVRFEVSDRGRVERIETKQAPDHPAFEDAVYRAIRQGKWKPGERNGRPVSAWVRRTIEFQP